MDSKNNLIKKINWQQERMRFLQSRICSLLDRDLTVIVNINGEEQANFTINPSEDNVLNLVV